jgi:hypothetical protein
MERFVHVNGPPDNKSGLPTCPYSPLIRMSSLFADLDTQIGINANYCGQKIIHVEGGDNRYPHMICMDMVHNFEEMFDIVDRKVPLVSPEILEHAIKNQHDPFHWDETLSHALSQNKEYFTRNQILDRWRLVVSVLPGNMSDTPLSDNEIVERVRGVFHLLESAVTGKAPYFPHGVKLSAEKCKLTPHVEEVGVFWSKDINIQATATETKFEAKPLENQALSGDNFEPLHDRIATNSMLP